MVMRKVGTRKLIALLAIMALLVSSSIALAQDVDDSELNQLNQQEEQQNLGGEDGGISEEGGDGFDEDELDEDELDEDELDEDEGTEGSIGAGNDFEGVSLFSIFRCGTNDGEGLDPNPGSLSITGEKIWDDNDDEAGLRPESVIINLYADEEKIDLQTITEDDGWCYSFDISDRPIFNDQENQVEYTVGEEEVLKYIMGKCINPTVTFITPEAGNWRKYPSCNNLDINISNTQDERTVVVAKVTGGKTPVVVWTVDALTNSERYAITEAIKSINEINPYGSIYFFSGYGSLATIGIDAISHLNMTVTDETVSFGGKNEWSMVFTGTYSRGSSEATESSITNRLVPQTVSIQVTKSWQDSNDQDGIRTEHVIVKLLADGDDTGKTLVLDAANDWTGIFTGLDKSKAGQDIEYTIEEVSVDGYTTDITGNAASGFTITNSHTPQTGDDDDSNGNDGDDDDPNGDDDDEPSGGGGGGGGGRRRPTPETIKVPEEPEVFTPPVEEPVVVEEPLVTAPVLPDLPHTGGNPAAFVFLGAALAGLGLYVRKRR